MKKRVLTLALLCACATSIFANPTDSITVHLTGSSTVTNIPAQFTQEQLVLTHPWNFGTPPGFNITATPTSDDLTVPTEDNMPALTLTAQQDGGTLTWYFYCNGLTLDYSKPNPNATIVFSGAAPSTPGHNVQCQCIGAACSTNEPVTAIAVMHDAMH